MHQKKKEVVVAVAGNPNCGKTSIFNALTGAHQHVGNYPGVTVEKKTGVYEFEGVLYHIVDLPGTYSLTAFSEDEKVARSFLVDEKPDVVVDVVDASNIERNMYLVAHLLELEVNLVIVLNMWDRAVASGHKLDLDVLSKRLHAPVVPTVGFKGTGKDELKKAIAHAAVSDREKARVWMGRDIEKEIDDMIALIPGNKGELKYPIRYLAIKFLENDAEIVDFLEKGNFDTEALRKQREKSIKRLKSRYNDSVEVLLGDRRYGFAAGLVQEATIQPAKLDRVSFSEQVDEILTHKYLGLPIFMAIIYGLFWVTFSLGSAPMEWIQSGIDFLSSFFIHTVFLDQKTVLESLIVDGILGGVGGVLVFLPNIVFLFLGIAILEDTGYMARVAFIMDKIMHKIGLHGRSFIPMLIGFGCTVPAILATRTLSSRKDRMITIMVLPLISCGARLPIYLLIIPAFFPVNLHPIILLSIYIIGILLAMFISLLLNKTLFSGVTTPFVMELPPYRLPSINGIIIHMWERSWMYLKKAGTIILGVSIIMWALSYFPRTTEFTIDKLIASGKVMVENDSESLQDPADIGKDVKVITKIEYANRKAAEELRNSAAGRIGRLIEPVLRPLGFDWKIGTAMIGAFAAKEVFVSQLGIVYSLGESDSEAVPLRDILKSIYNPLTGFCIMLFMLIATPCTATMAVVKKETGAWKWAFIQFIGLTVLAYILTASVHTLGTVFGIGV